jgi:anti-sigma B factor antagonist
MKIDTKETYHAVLLTPKGNMMGGPDTVKFQELVKSYIDQGKTNFVVDLGHVDFMNSPGLGVLITAYTSIKNAGGSLVVARPTKKIKTLFVITQIERIFKYFDEVEDALNSFASE